MRKDRHLVPGTLNDVTVRPRALAFILRTVVRERERERERKRERILLYMPERKRERMRNCVCAYVCVCVCLYPYRAEQTREPLRINKKLTVKNYKELQENKKRKRNK